MLSETRQGALTKGSVVHLDLDLHHVVVAVFYLLVVQNARQNFVQITHRSRLDQSKAKAILVKATILRVWTVITVSYP